MSRILPCRQGESYLVELETSGPLRSVDLEEGLEILGWTDGEDGPPIVDLSLQADSRLHRFVGRATKTLELFDEGPLRWSSALLLPFDPFADITKRMRPFRLETGTTYALRFLTRMKAQPKRENVEDVMRSMGFAMSCLSCLKRNMRIEGRPSVSCALWCGVGRWEGPRAVHAFEDPVSIEDASPLIRGPADPLVRPDDDDGVGMLVSERAGGDVHTSGPERGEAGDGVESARPVEARGM